MNMDVAVVSLAIVLLVTVGAGSVWLFRRHQLEVRKQEVIELAERRRKEIDDKKRREEGVTAGTLTESGKPRCKIQGCPREAGFARSHIVQDELSLRAWVRRQFGAARRYEAMRSARTGDYCATCAVLGSQVVEHGLSQSSERIANLYLEEDAALAHLESDGVDARVAELVAEQKTRASVPPSATKPSQIRRVGS